MTLALIEMLESEAFDHDWYSRDRPHIQGHGAFHLGRAADLRAAAARLREEMETQRRDLADDRWASMVLAALGRVNGGPLAVPATPPAHEPDPFCELAASEIPNFGTTRDTHRCAKAHRDKPFRSPGEGGEAAVGKGQGPGQGPDSLLIGTRALPRGAK